MMISRLFTEERFKRVAQPQKLNTLSRQIHTVRGDFCGCSGFEGHFREFLVFFFFFFRTHLRKKISNAKTKQYEKQPVQLGPYRSSSSSVTDHVRSQKNIGLHTE